MVGLRLGICHHRSSIQEHLPLTYNNGSLSQSTQTPDILFVDAQISIAISAKNAEKEQEKINEIKI